MSRCCAAVVAVLISGTLFYYVEEGWSVLDALYFSVVTLTTIGYGDYAPTSTLSKLFTMAYALTGIALIAGLITSLARYSVREQATADETPDSRDG